MRDSDDRTRKLMMHKSLHPRDDMDRLYVIRKGRGIKFANIKGFVDAVTQRLKQEQSEIYYSNQLQQKPN